MYYKLQEKALDYHNTAAVTEAYAQGYLFGRIAPGYAYQTRSLRVNLNLFSPNSENRRILAKYPEHKLTQTVLPLGPDDYDWRLSKLAKDFYATKFPDSKFSANKLKQLFTSEFHYNLLLNYYIADELVGHTICYENPELLHYCYPFYDLNFNASNLGMFMLLQAMLWAQLQGKKYFYVGGVNKPADKYKLQFSGNEWWDGDHWSADFLKLKEILIDKSETFQK